MGGRTKHAGTRSSLQGQRAQGGLWQMLDDFNSLRVIMVKLSDENVELLAKWEGQQSKPELRQQGDANYYFVGGDGPYCQPCYDKDHQLRNLTPRQELVATLGGSASCAEISLARKERPLAAPRSTRTIHTAGVTDGCAECRDTEWWSGSRCPILQRIWRWASVAGRRRR